MSNVPNRRQKENKNTGFRYRAKSHQLDPARECAFLVIKAVREDDAYANLLMPTMIKRMHLSRRDAAFATEMCYGTLRLSGRYDAILAQCSSRAINELDPQLLDILRLGAHQLLGMRVPAHAAVDQSVDLSRAYLSVGPSKFVNAVLRKVAEQDLNTWLSQITEGLPLPSALAAALSYPEWIVWALLDALNAAGRPKEELGALLKAQNNSPLVHLCARPGLITPDELADQAEAILDANTAFGRFSPYTVIISNGDPGRLPAVSKNLAGVEDEGSQLVATLLTKAPLEYETEVQDKRQLWVDLCAGPGGKTALLAALAAQENAHVQAIEISAHRAELVKDNTSALREVVSVNAIDGALWAEANQGKADRVLVDAPCSGLGSLRRRPEARFRRRIEDLNDLRVTQKKLLKAALKAVRVGGVIAYATCSPHLGETRAIIDAVRQDHPDAFEIMDAVSLAKQCSLEFNDTLGDGPYLQLWPHIHQTDAMFMALLVKKTEGI